MLLNEEHKMVKNKVGFLGKFLIRTPERMYPVYTVSYDKKRRTKLFYSFKYSRHADLLIKEVFYNRHNE